MGQKAKTPGLGPKLCFSFANVFPFERGGGGESPFLGSRCQGSSSTDRLCRASVAVKKGRSVDGLVETKKPGCLTTLENILLYYMFLCSL